MSASGPLSDPANEQFDFWIGKWELTWPAEQMGGTAGELGRGVNRIHKVLDGYVVEENFSFADGSFRGRSLSVYDDSEGLWRQTWVDSSGGYIALTGRFEDGRMILSTQPRKRDGRVVLNRMVFRDITGDSLEWDWQGSQDGGETWADLWNISYRRTVP